MPVSPPARHRSTARPSTALSELAGTAAGSIRTVTRRSVVTLASSGLILSGLGVPAWAAPLPESPGSALPAVDTSGVTASARAALQASTPVTVPADTAWTIDLPTVTLVADPPPPPPEPEPEPVRATAATSRSAARAEAPTEVSGGSVMEIAARYVGVPYLWGGSTPAGFDCSGFTAYVWAQLGVTLPHQSQAQKGAGTVVSRADARAGDLIVTPGHVALYAGDGMLIDATPGNTIRFHKVYQSNPVFIRVG